jgi:nicotinamide N-methyltransferase
MNERTELPLEMTISHEIPAEFLPKLANDDTTNGDSSEFGNLFHEDDDDDDLDPSDRNRDGTTTEEVTIAGLKYRLRSPPDVGTLFAHQVWSGSKFLADFLASNADRYLKNKRTVEFGAGTALPSLVALACGSQLSVITDYPDEGVLNAIKETVGCNWETCAEPLGRVAVVGHEWGTETDGVTQALSKMSGSDEQDDGNLCFDLAILSECLWMHRTHAALAQSLSKLLHSEQSFAVLTYAHHVPGFEEQDDAFFDLCNQYGFDIVHEESQEMAYMWDTSKTIVVNLKVLCRSKKHNATQEVA